MKMGKYTFLPVLGHNVSSISHKVPIINLWNERHVLIFQQDHNLVYKIKILTKNDLFY